jgi:hypothetical protein
MNIDRRHLLAGTAALSFVAAAPAVIRARKRNP